MISKQRYFYLDVLKAIAILAVVLYHSGFLAFGYLGVDCFLVINGYFITRGLYKKMECNERVGNQYISFEVSRVIRLLPVLLVVGVVCMMLGLFVMLPDDYENLSESVVATNFFGNNILAAITTKDYWDVVNEYKPLMHTWYVGLLMQFYIVYPLLFYVANLNKKNPKQSLIIILATLGAASLLAYFGTTNAAHRFYYLPSRFFEFAAGGIVAVSWKPQGNTHSFPRWFSLVCYGVLLAMILIGREAIPANIKLVVVVLSTVVLIMSGDNLENKITGNKVLARIGGASYSIFVWHQVLLAYYRYMISSSFTLGSYILFLLVVFIFSFLTYSFLEQKTGTWLNGKQSRIVLYLCTTVLWLGLSIFSGYIYLRGGVVRDVPELYISSQTKKTNHKEYNDKIYKLNKPFETGKRHWLVVGNSFGRDFANSVLESFVADSVEVSYIPIDRFSKQEYSERFRNADRVFLSSLGADEETVNRVKIMMIENDVQLDRLTVVGTKNFGESNGRFYVKRGQADYFNQRVKMQEGYMEFNDRMKHYCGDNYLDLIELVIDENGTMPVFTPDGHFVSQDCRHFSKGGAIWFSQLIDWNRFL